MSSTSREDLAENKNPANGDAIDQTTGLSPWKKFAGIWRENPDFDAFLQEIAELRRETDQAERKP